MSERMVLNSAARLSEALTRVTAMFKQHGYVKLTASTGKDRTLLQNNLWHSMYKRAADMTGQDDEEEIRRICKLEIGVRIMIRDSDEFREVWFRLFAHLTYEEKLALMVGHPVAGPEGLPVTRLFNRKQGIEYTDRIADKFRAQGVFFDDLLSEEAA